MTLIKCYRYSIQKLVGEGLPQFKFPGCPCHPHSLTFCFFHPNTSIDFCGHEQVRSVQVDITTIILFFLSVSFNLCSRSARFCKAVLDGIGAFELTDYVFCLRVPEQTFFKNGILETFLCVVESFSIR